MPAVCRLPATTKGLTVPLFVRVVQVVLVYLYLSHNKILTALTPAPRSITVVTVPERARLPSSHSGVTHGRMLTRVRLSAPTMQRHAFPVVILARVAGHVSPAQVPMAATIAFAQNTSISIRHTKGK